jgi:PEP-CTERM motif
MQVLNAVMACASFVAIATSAAATVYDLRYVGYTGDVELTATISATGGEVTSGSATLSPAWATLGGDALSDVPLYPNPDPGAVSYSPSGFFLYDDLIYHGIPVLDVDGLLFVTAGGIEYNLWANGPGAYQLYEYNPATGAAVTDTGTLFVPEPEGWTLTLLGIGIVGAALRARKAIPTGA